jgi:hypothetical protein
MAPATSCRPGFAEHPRADRMIRPVSRKPQERARREQAPAGMVSSGSTLGGDDSPVLASRLRLIVKLELLMLDCDCADRPSSAAAVCACCSSRYGRSGTRFRPPPWQSYMRRSAVRSSSSGVCRRSGARLIPRLAVSTTSWCRGRTSGRLRVGAARHGGAISVLAVEAGFNDRELVTAEAVRRNPPRTGSRRCGSRPFRAAGRRRGWPRV